MRVLTIIILTLFAVPAFSQQGETLPISASKLSGYLDAVGKKYHSLDAQVEKDLSKTISRLRRHEMKLARKLARKDTAAARALRENSAKYYDGLLAKVQGSDSTKQLKEYIPAFDTAKTTLGFLTDKISPADLLYAKLSESKKTLQAFGQRMQVANELKKQLKERRQLLAGQLERFGMVKELKQLNKEVYYYQQRLGEYKAMLKDPEKIECKAIALLRESEAFKSFMKKHSMLAQLFKLPDDYGSVASLAGLQTQAGVQAALAQRFAGAGVNPQQYVQGQLKAAQAEMNKVKKKIRDLAPSGSGSSSSDIEMPEGFKPNTQKTKSFLQRLEYGTNFQTQQLNSYFPTTTDIALTVGYKLNDKSVIGIGTSYKFGLGSIQRIRLTHEGAGVRSYIDWKLRGSIWISGGYEQNYLQRFSDFRAISDISVWRQSALLGLTKKVKVGKKTSKVQLMYDFFYIKDNIRTQPLIFRVGYGI
jgi:hypothetical protein